MTAPGVSHQAAEASGIRHQAAQWTAVWHSVRRRAAGRPPTDDIPPARPGGGGGGGGSAGRYRPTDGAAAGRRPPSAALPHRIIRCKCGIYRQPDTICPRRAQASILPARSICTVLWTWRAQVIAAETMHH